MTYDLRRRRREEVYSKSELISEKSPQAISEAYDAMRTNLMFLMSNTKRVIAFTSALEAEGKTTTCLNMAILFGQMGNKVLVIDMDMRRPRTHRYFETPSSPGLSDRLGNFTKDLHILKTSCENVFLFPAGTIPPSPPELLISPNLDVVLEELKKEYDYIFIDTPPTQVATDVTIISNRVDGIVFVVREKATTKEIIKKSVLNLERVGAKFLGFVLNDSTGNDTFDKYRYKSGYKLVHKETIRDKVISRFEKKEKPARGK